MIIVLKKTATPQELEHICQKVRELGLTPRFRGHRTHRDRRDREEEKLQVQPLEVFPGWNRSWRSSGRTSWRAGTTGPRTRNSTWARREGRGKKVVVMAGRVRWKVMTRF